ncbi:hypothetical protein SAMN05660862_2785 [Sphingobacterium psychroaquaticum]|uniref:Uncharacterized protein n=1 Tax=Sphingobacterium psychroaquaticum TaxID=561061 RepID=A0A1X7KF19_9SPHI|nr:hypothetical protein SAMN05660862_2785 [Sphingobacterium psychroaquaticum]
MLILVFDGQKKLLLLTIPFAFLHLVFYIPVVENIFFFYLKKGKTFGFALYSALEKLFVVLFYYLCI